MTESGHSFVTEDLRSPAVLLRYTVVKGANDASISMQLHLTGCLLTLALLDACFSTLEVQKDAVSEQHVDICGC